MDSIPRRSGTQRHGASGSLHYLDVFMRLVVVLLCVALTSVSVCETLVRSCVCCARCCFPLSSCSLFAVRCCPSPSSSDCGLEPTESDGQRTGRAPTPSPRPRVCVHARSASACPLGLWSAPMLRRTRFLRCCANREPPSLAAAFSRAVAVSFDSADAFSFLVAVFLLRRARSSRRQSRFVEDAGRLEGGSAQCNQHNSKRAPHHALLSLSRGAAARRSGRFCVSSARRRKGREGESGSGRQTTQGASASEREGAHAKHTHHTQASSGRERNRGKRTASSRRTVDASRCRLHSASTKPRFSTHHPTHKRRHTR